MGKYVVGAIAFILVIAGGYYFLNSKKAAPTVTPSGGTQSTVVATSTYATSTYSVVYPADFTVDPNFSNTEVNPKKPIMGVKLTIPGTMATGTNLGTDTFLSIEQLPRAKNCTGDIFLLDNVKPTTESNNGVTYSVAKTAGVGAGNQYDETIYAITGSNPCTAVRYFVHTSNIDNYPAGSVTAFDPSALTAAFDKIRASLTLTR